jgi:hypothetical protein
MSDIHVTRHEKGAWTDEVFEALARLLGPGSGPGRAILEHELLRCDLLYLARDAEGPCAFLLGARVRLPVGPERRQARYLGLSVARSDRGNDAVLEQFTADARDEERSRGVRLVLFTAAATRSRCAPPRPTGATCNRPPTPRSGTTSSRSRTRPGRGSAPPAVSTAPSPSRD